MTTSITARRSFHRGLLALLSATVLTAIAALGTAPPASAWVQGPYTAWGSASATCVDWYNHVVEVEVTMQAAFAPQRVGTDVQYYDASHGRWFVALGFTERVIGDLGGHASSRTYFTFRTSRLNGYLGSRGFQTRWFWVNYQWVTGGRWSEPAGEFVAVDC